ncbi:methylenetetrahydrofolate reductase (NADH), partial [Lecanoromycetidae sp. Uapishka_2]
MEKITDKIAALPDDSNYFSLEFFPPKTQIVLGLTTCLHLTCTNMKRKVVDEALEQAKVLGIRNILALRGDPPRHEEYKLEDEVDDGNEEDSNADFTWAIDLVRYIRQVHGDYFCIGVAGYPEGHADQSHPMDQDPLHDLPYLIDKTKAGADFIMTQLFYDLDAYTKYERLLREHDSGVFASIPILPGLMPLQSYDILVRTTKLAHAKVPSELLQRLHGVKGDDEAVKQVGLEYLSEIVNGIKEVKATGPRGFHFYTLNLEKAVSSLLERCNLIPPDPDENAIEEIPFLPNGINGVISHSRTLSSTDSTVANQLTTNSHRSSSPTRTIPPTVNGHSREATWDDYPNGRFGDARSPAFNPPLTYSPTSLTVTPTQALSLWGTPTENQEISRLFTSHVAGHDPKKLPWSESATLSPETALITSELTALTTNKGYWTIASQPSVDGLSSTHSIHGWGPPSGFVFQKSFVEFFVDGPIFQEKLHPQLKRLHEDGEVSYYAGNAAGEFISSEAPEAVHAVTWGSFAGKEIATATMVEEVSFRAWVEEAFSIWGEWGRCVGEASRLGKVGRDEARKSMEFLRGVKRGVWLVNVIGHNYRERGRLWEVLTEG